MTGASFARSEPRNARLATSAIFLANGFGIGNWAAAIPRLKESLSLSDANLSLALLALAAGSVLFMPVAGLASPRLGGTGRVLCFSAIAFPLTLALPGFAPSLFVLAGLTFLIGMSNGMMDVPMNAHATVVERNKGRPIMSSFHAAWSLGGLAGSGFGGLMIAAGLPTDYLLLPGAAVALALAIAAIPHLGAGEVAKSAGPALAWPDGRTLGFCIIGLLCFFLEGAMADWSGVYLLTVAHAPAALAAGGYAAFASMMVVGRFAGDRLVRRLGAGRVILGGAALAAAGFLLAVLVAAAPAIMLGFALIGLGLSNVVPSIFSASARASASPALAIAQIATCGYAGFLGGPPLIGEAASLFGLRAAFGLLALGAVLVAGTTVRLRIGGR